MIGFPITGIPLSVKLLIVAVLMGGSYVTGRVDGSNGAKVDQKHDEAIARTAYESAQRGAAEEIAKLEIKNVTIHQRIQRETREVPVYRDCKHSPDGLRTLNAALENRPLATPDSKLP